MVYSDVVSRGRSRSARRWQSRVSRWREAICSSVLPRDGHCTGPQIRYALGTLGGCV